MMNCAFAIDDDQVGCAESCCERTARLPVTMRGRCRDNPDARFFCSRQNAFDDQIATMMSIASGVIQQNGGSHRI